MVSEAKKKANAKSNKKNSVLFPLRLNKNTDQDIILELETKYSKAGYIKDLIRKDVAEMLEKRKAELAKWNEEEDQQDTMYYLEERHYNKYGEDITGDPVYAMSDDLEEIEKAFEHEVYLEKDKKGVVIDIMRFTQIYNNTPEYESIKKFSTVE